MHACMHVRVRWLGLGLGLHMLMSDGVDAVVLGTVATV